jgi:hypothetical protein
MILTAAAQNLGFPPNCNRLQLRQNPDQSMDRWPDRPSDSAKESICLALATAPVRAKKSRSPGSSCGAPADRNPVAEANSRNPAHCFPLA